MKIVYAAEIGTAIFAIAFACACCEVEVPSVKKTEVSRPPQETFVSSKDPILADLVQLALSWWQKYASDFGGKMPDTSKSGWVPMARSSINYNDVYGFVENMAPESEAWSITASMRYKNMYYVFRRISGDLTAEWTVDSLGEKLQIMQVKLMTGLFNETRMLPEAEVEDSGVKFQKTGSIDGIDALHYAGFCKVYIKISQWLRQHPEIRRDIKIDEMPLDWIRSEITPKNPRDLFSIEPKSGYDSDVKWIVTISKKALKGGGWSIIAHSPRGVIIEWHVYLFPTTTFLGEVILSYSEVTR